MTDTPLEPELTETEVFEQKAVRLAKRERLIELGVGAYPVGVPITDTNNRPIVIPTIESVQDVKLQALTYDAQVGRTGGGVFNTLLRSGSNTLHGSIFGATRQTAWLANDFFAKREGIGCIVDTSLPSARLCAS